MIESVKGVGSLFSTNALSGVTTETSNSEIGRAHV